MGFKEGQFVMLELKVVSRGKQVRLSPHQVAFHLRHADYGCPTFILVHHIPRGVVKESMLLLYGGNQVIELVKLGVDLQPIDQWSWTGAMWEMIRFRLLTA